MSKEKCQRKKKFSFIWEQTTVSCGVANKIRSERIFTEALQHETQENIQKTPQ